MSLCLKISVTLIFLLMLKVLFCNFFFASYIFLSWQSLHGSRAHIYWNFTSEDYFRPECEVVFSTSQGDLYFLLTELLTTYNNFKTNIAISFLSNHLSIVNLISSLAYSYISQENAFLFIYFSLLPLVQVSKKDTFPTSYPLWQECGSCKFHS